MKSDLPPIPFVNLDAQYQRLRPQLLAAFETVMEDRSFIQGRFTAEFAVAFCRVHRIGAGVGCANGTTALVLALEVLGIGPGDEVITQANSFIATAEAICEVGATPILVDIDANTYGIDLAQAEAAIGPRTRALLPVHLYGVPGNIDALEALAAKHGLLLIEDAAQAHLATWNGRAVGSGADAVTFSFYPSKNLGAYGDAGLVAFRNAEYTNKAARLLNHGRADKYAHDLIGHNWRMDGLQGALLSVKLPFLAEWNERRRANARRYDARLKSAGFKAIELPAAAAAVYHLYVVEVANRTAVQAAFAAAHIECGVHYPVPLHLQPALARYGPQRGSLPVTETAAERLLSLPMCAELSEQQVDRVCDVLLAHGRP